jgi:hypothetical protein
VLGVVDFHALGQVIWVSFVASLGATVLFSFSIYGFGRAHEARRAGRGSTAALYGTFAVLALVVFGAAVVAGVAVMLNKG